jgi:hypothetical protein
MTLHEGRLRDKRLSSDLKDVAYADSYRAVSENGWANKDIFI